MIQILPNCQNSNFSKKLAARLHAKLTWRLTAVNMIWPSTKNLCRWFFDGWSIWTWWIIYDLCDIWHMTFKKALQLEIKTLDDVRKCYSSCKNDQFQLVNNLSTNYNFKLKIKKWLILAGQQAVSKCDKERGLEEGYVSSSSHIYMPYIFISHICEWPFRTSLFMLAHPKNFTKDELGELFCMELEGLTLSSFFQAKEKCTTLKCVKYNVRKSQVTKLYKSPKILIKNL